MANPSKIHPVILSGGAGTRLWPVSRAIFLKQLMPLTGEQSLLHETASRVSDPARFAAPLVICNEDHRFMVAEQLQHHQHWVVVQGTAEVTHDSEIFTLTENQSTFIPLGTVHRLRNPGKIPLHIVEVQSGGYSARTISNASTTTMGARGQRLSIVALLCTFATSW